MCEFTENNNALCSTQEFPVYFFMIVHSCDCLFATFVRKGLGFFLISGQLALCLWRLCHIARAKLLSYFKQVHRVVTSFCSFSVRFPFPICPIQLPHNENRVVLNRFTVPCSPTTVFCHLTTLAVFLKYISLPVFIFLIQREKNKLKYTRFTVEGKKKYCDPTKWNCKGKKLFFFKESNLADSSRFVCKPDSVHTKEI